LFTHSLIGFFGFVSPALMSHMKEECL